MKDGERGEGEEKLEGRQGKKREIKVGGVRDKIGKAKGRQEGGGWET